MSIIKNYFHQTRLNAICIRDCTIYRLFEETIVKYFRNLRLKITRCERILEDIVDGNNLTDRIEKEHHRNNHRDINENFKQLRTMIYHPLN